MVAQFAIARVEEIRKRLVEAPELVPTTVTRADAIRMLAPEIAQMKAKGYSLGKVAAFLGGEGIAISPGALKRSLRSPRLQPRGDRPKARTERPSARVRKGPGTPRGSLTDAATELHAVAPAVADGAPAGTPVDLTRGPARVLVREPAPSDAPAAHVGDGAATGRVLDCPEAGSTERSAGTDARTRAERAGAPGTVAPAASAGLDAAAPGEGESEADSRKRKGASGGTASSPGAAGPEHGPGARLGPMKGAARGNAEGAGVPSWSFRPREDSDDL
jgi:hypothetical protein